MTRRRRPVQRLLIDIQVCKFIFDSLNLKEATETEVRNYTSRSKGPSIVYSAGCQSPPTSERTHSTVRMLSPDQESRKRSSQTHIKSSASSMRGRFLALVLLEELQRCHNGTALPNPLGTLFVGRFALSEYILRTHSQNTFFS